MAENNNSWIKSHVTGQPELEEEKFDGSGGRSSQISVNTTL